MTRGALKGRRTATQASGGLAAIGQDRVGNETSHRESCDRPCIIALINADRLATSWSTVNCSSSEVESKTVGLVAAAAIFALCAGLLVSRVTMWR